MVHHFNKIKRSGSSGQSILYFGRQSLRFNLFVFPVTVFILTNLGLGVYGLSPLLTYLQSPHLQFAHLR